jgi:hypothetical protein
LPTSSLRSSRSKGEEITEETENTEGIMCGFSDPRVRTRSTIGPKRRSRCAPPDISVISVVPTVTASRDELRSTAR